jgi:uncharacterized protein (DUF1697 family)
MTQRLLALLRGINVGGNALVPMPVLRATFERVGGTDVVTYLNTGNVLFTTTAKDRRRLATKLETAVADDHGIATRILLRDRGEVQRVLDDVPHAWTNRAEERCEVLFLAPEIDRPDVVDQLPPKAGIDDLRYVPGAVVWHIERRNRTKTGMTRMVGTEVYQGLSIRSLGTVQKLATMLADD